jgi:hypothetical protein
MQRNPGEYCVLGTDEIAAEYQHLLDSMAEFLVALERGELSRDQFDIGPVVQHLAAEFSILPKLSGKLLTLFQAIKYADVAVYVEQMRREHPNFDAVAEQIRREFPKGPPPELLR